MTTSSLSLGTWGSSVRSTVSPTLVLYHDGSLSEVSSTYIPLETAGFWPGFRNTQMLSSTELRKSARFVSISEIPLISEIISDTIKGDILGSFGALYVCYTDKLSTKCRSVFFMTSFWNPSRNKRLRIGDSMLPLILESSPVILGSDSSRSSLF